MEIEFFKYQGTGNDFIMVDGESQDVNISADKIKKICDRRFGIGADGVIVLRKHIAFDFDMDYYNADGTKSFCGNGSRCAQAFARQLGWIKEESTFLAIDGKHQGKKMDDNFATHMMDVEEIERLGSDYFIHTGSPHYIRYVENVDSVDVEKEGKRIRNSKKYIEEGTNVNFVNVTDGCLKVRTYERGVEGETFSCGTGVTAVAISYLDKTSKKLNDVNIQTKGGALSVSLDRTSEEVYQNIWLIGPAKMVYKGSFEL